ncbi:MAG: hypothetical protein GXZ08_02180 [Tissierellia bacterium]|nr:hypothetical protein [Tissierellia bacterium]
MKKLILIIMILLLFVTGCDDTKAMRVVDLDGVSINLPNNWARKNGSNGTYLTDLKQVILYDSLDKGMNNQDIFSYIKSSLNFYDLGKFPRSSRLVVDVAEKDFETILSGHINESKLNFKIIIFENTRTNFLIVVGDDMEAVEKLYDQIIK